MKTEFESEMVWNGNTSEKSLKLSFWNQFVFFAALLIVNVVFLYDLKMQ